MLSFLFVDRHLYVDHRISGLQIVVEIPVCWFLIIVLHPYLKVYKNSASLSVSLSPVKAENLESGHSLAVPVHRKLEALLGFGNPFEFLSWITVSSSLAPLHFSFIPSGFLK